MSELKQKLLAILDKWDESESEDYLTTEQTKFAMSLIDILCQQRAALAIIRDNPTSDSVGVINNANNWTKWAKRKASETFDATDEALKRMGVE